MRRAVTLLAALAAAGCPRPYAEQAHSSDTTDGPKPDGIDDPTPTLPDETSTTGTTAGEGSETAEPSEDEDPQTTDSTFVSQHDLSGVDPQFQCDAFVQDCQAGEKCVPWDHDGHSHWDGLRCVPIVPNPHAVGERCTIEESPFSGLDDCAVDAACWYVDPETLEGVCMPLCIDIVTTHTCDEGYVCPVAGGWTPPVCSLACNPLSPECFPDQGCYGGGNQFTCQRDVSGDGGSPGDPCDFVNGCDPGNACLGAAAIPSCDGSGCCVPYCDLSNPEAHAACAAFDPGTSCLPWYGPYPPEGFETLGKCVLPR